MRFIIVTRFYDFIQVLHIKRIYPAVVTTAWRPAAVRCSNSGGTSPSIKRMTRRARRGGLRFNSAMALVNGEKRRRWWGARRFSR
jgi:hypothetical protein